MTADAIVGFLFLFLLVFPAFGFYLYFMSTIYHHEVSKDAIRIRFMGFMTLRKVELTDIEAIEVVNTLELPDPTIMFYAEKWPGKHGKEGVLIHKRTGLSRVLLMSPENPREFVESVNKIREAKKRGQHGDEK